MASGGGISGIGLAVATGGALLVYAGFRGVNPIEALRDVASGKPPKVESRSAGLSVGRGLGSVGGSGGGLPALVDAVRKYSSDEYSQARRWEPGFSDCSSFVGKGLKDLGITPPGFSTTTDYLRSSQWVKISRSDAGAGDLAVTAAHMVVFIGNREAIGQQNPKRDVEAGPVEDLMYPQGDSFTVLRYRGAKDAPQWKGVMST